jgi:hypothetical protein
MAATTDGGTPCVSLVYQYPPSPAAVVVNNQFVSMAGFAQIALLRCPIPFADSLDGAAKVAEVVLRDGTPDGDVARAKEALTMFRYNSRVREDALTKASEDIEVLIKAYHRIATWLLDGATEAWTDTILGTTLRATP